MKLSARCRVGLGLALFLAIAATVWFTRPQEPSYQGRTLTEWLETWNKAYFGNGAALATEKEFIEAETAIRAIGTNALPILVKMYERKDSRLKRGVLEALQKVEWFRQQLRTEDHDHDLGGAVLAMLGTNALPILPIIRQRLTAGNPGDWDPAILARMGPEAASDVAALMTNSIPRVRLRTLGNLSTNQFKTAKLFEILDIGAADPDPAVRMFFYLRLGRTEPSYQLDIGLVLPRLTLGFQDVDAGVRRRACDAAGSLGVAAADLLPQLKGLAANDPDPNVRASAANAIEKIQIPPDSGAPAAPAGN